MNKISEPYLNLMEPKRNALLSLFDKQGSEQFAAALIKRGFNIISSGGTATYLKDKGIPITPVSEITGREAVLGHRVVTLDPALHGGLLATEEMQPELDKLGWKRIHLLYVTFYPLGDELYREGATFESCLEKTDIGGPALVRSSNKGGRITMVNSDQEHHVLQYIDNGEIDKEFLSKLWWRGEGAVSEYLKLSTESYRVHLDSCSS